MVSISYTQSLCKTNCELDLKNIYLTKIILTFGFHSKDDRIVTKLERNQRFKLFKVPIQLFILTAEGFFQLPCASFTYRYNRENVANVHFGRNRIDSILL